MRMRERERKKVSSPFLRLFDPGKKEEKKERKEHKKFLLDIKGFFSVSFLLLFFHTGGSQFTSELG